MRGSPKQINKNLISPEKVAFSNVEININLE
jgi:hypothetical protein